MGAASLAANAALLSFRRPEATVSPDTQRVTVHSADVREPIPLALHHLPVAVTFGFFAEQDGLVVVDPTVNEEMVIGRVALTPGCQIGYMDHTGCHQIN